MKKQLGFTLIELLVVIAIIGILSAIALPSYNEHILRGRIPDATSGLATRAVQMEQFFQDNRTYVGAPACVVAATQHFSFSCTAATAAAYTLQAQGINSMVNFRYTMNQAGARVTQAVQPGWVLSNPSTCWVTRKTGTC